MKLIVSKKANVNYLAKVIKIEVFKPHTDPEVTRLKCCTVDGFNIICGIDSEPGWYVYFPTACCLNPDFLKYANLYRHKELNADAEQSGMFEDNGRVKAIRLRGELSEGFILPAVTLENYLLSVDNIDALTRLFYTATREVVDFTVSVECFCGYFDDIGCAIVIVKTEAEAGSDSDGELQVCLVLIHIEVVCLLVKAWTYILINHGKNIVT